MNEKKFEIVKKALGTNKWSLKEDSEKYPNRIFIFNGDGKIISRYWIRTKILDYSAKNLYLKIYSLFGYRYEQNNRLIKFLIGSIFGWKIEMTDLISNKGVPNELFNEMEEHFKQKTNKQ